MPPNHDHPHDYDPGLASRIKRKIRNSLFEADVSNEESPQYPEYVKTVTGLQLKDPTATRGGLGEVLRYHDEHLSRDVAVKFTRKKTAPGSWSHARFLREARITGLLDHPGVVPVFNSGSFEGRPWYSMRFVNGRTLQAAIAQAHKDSGFQIRRDNRVFISLIESFRTVCMTIDYAHRVKQVWHRDIKPANIMLDGRVTLVVDWGLAKRAGETDEFDELLDQQTPQLTTEGQILGTPWYMAPEQAAGDHDRVDHRADIYGLGATLFEILTGTPPHKPLNDPELETPAEMADKTTLEDRPSRPVHRQSPVSPRHLRSEIPGELESICLKALAHEPEDRYQTAGDLLEELDKWMLSAEVSAHRYSLFERIAAWTRRHAELFGAILIAVIFFFVLTAAGLLWVNSERAKTAIALTDYQRERHQRIEQSIDSLISLPAAEASVVLRELRAASDEVSEQLISRLHQGQLSKHEKLRLQLAIFDGGKDSIEELKPAILDAESAELPLVVQVIKNSPGIRGDAEACESYWNSVESGRPVNLNSATILAAIDPDSPKWQRIAYPVAEELTKLDSSERAMWAGLLADASHFLEVPLLAISQSSLEDFGESRQAANETLLQWSANKPDLFARLLINADKSTFARLKRKPWFVDAEFRKEFIEKSLSNSFSWHDWNGLESNPGKPLPDSARKILDSGFGLATDQFAVCQSVADQDLPGFIRVMDESGYRPVGLRFFRERGKDFWALAWKRDSRRWRIATKATLDQLRQLDEKYSSEGFLPCDVISRNADPDTNTPVFAALWMESLGEQIARMHIDSTRDEHSANSQAAFRDGMGQTAFVHSDNLDGSESYIAIYSRPSFQSVEGTTTVFQSTLQLAREKLKDLVPVKLNCTGLDQFEVGIWQNREDLEATILECPFEEFPAKARQLAGENYRPVAVSGFSTDPENRYCVTVWHRPKLQPRQLSNLAIFEFLCGDDRFWNLLRPGEDNTVRTALIHRLASEGIPVGELLDRLTTESNAGIRAAIVLALGEYSLTDVEEDVRSKLIAALQLIHADDPDSSVHSAANWTLKRWGVEPELAIDDASRTEARHWMLNSQGQTLAIFRQPIRLEMGTRKPTTSFSPGDESFHTRTINRNFAIGTHEVTWAQFARYRPEKPHGHTYWYSSANGSGRLNPQSPQNQVSWYEAAGYCNWLSQQEGLSENEWCYLPNDDGEYAEGMTVAEDFLQRKGYRLPTEAEWEFATRGGTDTSHFFGNDPDMLDKYGWHVGNSTISTHSVGMLKPNDFGLFDVYGNVWEWTQNSRDDDWPEFGATVDDNFLDVPLTNDHLRMLRGGSFINPAPLQRSAVRSFNTPTNELFTIGFRIAKTINAVSEKE